MHTRFHGSLSPVHSIPYTAPFAFTSSQPATGSIGLLSCFSFLYSAIVRPNEVNTVLLLSIIIWVVIITRG